jgi:hypothetical protein
MTGLLQPEQPHYNYQSPYKPIRNEHQNRNEISTDLMAFDYQTPAGEYPLDLDSGNLLGICAMIGTLTPP